MSVLALSGKPINWAKPPAANARVMWSRKTSGGKRVTGSLRTIAHLDHLDTLAVKKYGKHIVVLQPAYNTGVKASEGTHDYDACLDGYIPAVPWREQERFFRANGAGAWWRNKSQGFSNHIHWFVLPPREGSDVNDDFKVAGFKVGKYVDGGWSTKGRRIASSQIEDYYDHKTGLKGHQPDYGSWFPKDIRATIFNLPAYIKRQQVGPGAPKPPTGKPAKVLRFAHMSMQFSDPLKQQTADIEKVFAQGYDVITGTEVGKNFLYVRSELRRVAKEQGYFYSGPRDYNTWVVVKKSIVAHDSWKSGATLALKGSASFTPKPPGKWGRRGLVWGQFSLGGNYGVVSVGAVHYVTRGGSGKRKTALDKAYAKVIGLWGRRHAAGSKLAFVAGDMNLIDRKTDVFYGQPFVTCWDDLEEWPNTGHGNIDVIARYKPDARVKCIGARVLDDRKFFLHTDHFLVEAEYRIASL